MLIQERFKSPDKVFEKVYGIFDKRDYFNVKGLAKVQIGNFERALQKNDKGAQQILDKFKGDEKKAKEYIIQVIHDRKKEQAFEAFKAFKSVTSFIVVVIEPSSFLIDTATGSSFKDSLHPPSVVPLHPQPQSSLDSKILSNFLLTWISIPLGLLDITYSLDVSNILYPFTLNLDFLIKGPICFNNESAKISEGASSFIDNSLDSFIPKRYFICSSDISPIL